MTSVKRQDRCKLQCLTSNDTEKVEKIELEKSDCYTFIIFGASGDLSSKKLIPALWDLYKADCLPNNTRIYGYSRSLISAEDIKGKILAHLTIISDEEKKFEDFWNLFSYLPGKYNSEEDIKRLDTELTAIEKGHIANRIYYFAVPPLIFEQVTLQINNCCKTHNGWSRIVVEKPHGRDASSSDTLSKHLDSLFTKEEIYRIDHYLGKEMIQNIMSIRFANMIFGPVWNRNCVACIRVTLKETNDVDRRGGYFDEYGIIRDVMVNHLLQVLSLVTMEKPATHNAKDIQNEKVKVLKCTKPVELKDVVLGQYIGNPKGEGPDKCGYKDDPTVHNDSITPTYAAAVVYIDNERWDGTPMILLCGKALDENKSEIRIQFKDVPGDIFDNKTKRNELVIRIQPHEALYVKVMIKTPGMTFDLEETELDLTYQYRYSKILLPDAYVRLILDIFSGSQMPFVSADEVWECWRIFTPLLHRMENEAIKPTPYTRGSRGPSEGDELLSNNNYVFSGSYKWKNPHTR